jgi:hypothetical protein
MWEFHVVEMWLNSLKNYKHCMDGMLIYDFEQRSINITQSVSEGSSNIDPIFLSSTI